MGNQNFWLALQPTHLSSFNESKDPATPGEWTEKSESEHSYGWTLGIELI